MQKTLNSTQELSSHLVQSMPSAIEGRDAHYQYVHFLRLDISPENAHQCVYMGCLPKDAILLSMTLVEPKPLSSKDKDQDKKDEDKKKEGKAESGVKMTLNLGDKALPLSLGVTYPEQFYIAQDTHVSVDLDALPTEGKACIILQFIHKR